MRTGEMSGTDFGFPASPDDHFGPLACRISFRNLSEKGFAFAILKLAILALIASVSLCSARAAADVSHPADTGLKPNGSTRGFSTDTPALASLIREALAGNPALAPSAAALEAAGELGVQAWALPDPMVTLGVFASEVETRVGPQRGKVTVGQMVPARRKRLARTAVAESMESIESARFDLVRARVVRDTRIAYFEIYLTDRTISAVQDDLELTGFHESLAVAGYQAGISGYADILRSQVALSGLGDRIRSLRELRASQVIRLNTQLGRPVGQTFETLARMEPEELSIPDPAEVRALSASRSPEVTLLLMEAEKSRRGIELARTAGRSDMTYRLDYTPTSGASMPGVADSGKDPLLATVSFDIPLDREKYRAGVREAEARHRAALGKIEERRRYAVADMATAIFNFNDGIKKALLFRDSILPKAMEAVKVTQEGYRSGGSLFSDLLDSQRTLLEFRLSMERAMAEAGKARALVGYLASETPISGDPEDFGEKRPMESHRHGTRPDPGGGSQGSVSPPPPTPIGSDDLASRLEIRMKAYRSFKAGRGR